MKNWPIAAVILLCLALVIVTACNPLGSNAGKVVEQLVKVVKGDLTVTVSGSGNIEVANEAKLSFGIAGKVDKIYVEEGDTVAINDVLAKLDTDALELALSQAQVAQTKSQVAVSEAQVTLQTAEYNLDQAEDSHILVDIKVAQADVDEAQRNLDEALRVLSKYSPGSEGEEFWQKAVINAQARLNTAKDTLEAMLSGTDTAEVAIKRLQVEVAKQSLELAQQSLEVTKKSLAQAQKQLDEATIIAPFKGVVAKVSVDEKDTVLAATTIVHLIDPSRMVLEVGVDEIDIAAVKLGQRATISIDALPSLPLEGKVSFISLLPTEEAGVITYNVKVEFDVPDGVGIRDGMSATADITTDKRSNVLLVPDRAIKKDSQGNTTIDVMVNGQTEERTVVTGISDGLQTETIDGLKEGEVVLERRTAPKQPSGRPF